MTTRPTNAHCPDWDAHYQNAVDRLFPLGAPSSLSEDEDAVCQEWANEEYLVCEGH
jgi:hypothetical protein